jgi:hydroxymethylglutaryl-CoA lyase
VRPAIRGIFAKRPFPLNTMEGQTLATDVNAEVLIQEVGPRDGLQNEVAVLTPEVRADLVNRLVNAGLQRVQIGSFVNPARVPQMAHTDKVWSLVNKKAHVRYSVLVLNERGLDQAMESGVPHVEIYVSASETHSQKNTNMGVSTALELASNMIRRAVANDLGVTAGVMCAFGCFYEGPVATDNVLELVRAFEQEGPQELALADTAGLAEPEGIRRVLTAVNGMVNWDKISVHLHDTRGFGLANLREALSLGVRRFDASVGGLGGCPFIPGATGNISTEDTVKVAESMGFTTGIDLNALIDVRSAFEKALLNK